MKELIKQYFYLLDVEAKRKVPFLLFNFLFSSLLDVVGIGLIGVFLLTLSNNPLLVFTNKPLLHDYLQNFSQQAVIILFGISIVIALMIKSVAAIWIQREVTQFSQSFGLRLNIRMMRAYQFAPYSYQLQVSSATALTRINQANTFVNQILSPSIILLSNFIVGAVILIALILTAPIPTLLLMMLFFLIGISQDLVVKKHLRSAGEELSLLSSERHKAIEHGLKGLKEIRILGKEKYFLSNFTFFSERLIRGSIAILNWSVAPRYLIENGIAIFIIGLSLIGISSGYSMSAIVAMMGMFAVAGIRLLPIMVMIISNINTLRAHYPTMQLVCDTLSELDAMDKISFLRESNEEAHLKLGFSSSILLENISFSYPMSKLPALSQVSIQIIKGQSIGLIGPSGAGKSTLANLLLGLLIPQKGQLLIDGKPVSDLRSWYEHLAYIPQSIFLLDDTLKRNIAMGIEDTNINETQLSKVIEMTQLKELVEQLPQGLNTFIGENGVRLSGGQQQRVALARALYFERDVIVMDEATSSLDNETEKEVINAIKQLKGKYTIIVIAHRLSTVEHCDVLYRLEHGRITAGGSYQEVVKS
jgi:ABC-type multidrug transport system fused ATPase/permease subunit